MNKTFRRVREGKKIAGVCTGLAKYTEVDVVWWRLGFLIGAFHFLGFAYLCLVILSSYESVEDNTLKR